MKPTYFEQGFCLGRLGSRGGRWLPRNTPEKEALEGTAQILHIFVPPAPVARKALVGADSTKQALKLPADTPLVVDGTTLNAAALTAIAALLSWEFKIKVKATPINEVYAGEFAL